LFVCWTLGLLFLTLQNGIETEKAGKYFASWVMKAFRLHADSECIHLGLRRFAHVIAFAGEAFLLHGVRKSFSTLSENHFTCLASSFLICFFLCFLSELIKIHIEGRHFHVVDCLLNLLGSAIGLSPGLLQGFLKKKTA